MNEVRLRGMNLNLLSALDALLTEKNVTRAARRAGVSQPAMSRSLKQLRELLDDELLVKCGRALVATPRAERLEVPLKRTLADLERLLSDRPDFDPRQERRRFVIAAPDYIAAMIAPPLIERVSSEAPGIEFNFVPPNRVNANWALETGRFDVLVQGCNDPAKGLHIETLWMDRFVCAVKEDHPVVTGDTLDLETFASLPHILISITDSISPGSVDIALEEAGLSRNIVCRMRYFMVAPLLVKHSNAVITAPERLLQRFATRGGLRIVEPPVPLHQVPYEMVWHERYVSDPAHQWLRDELRGVGDRYTDIEETLPWVEQWGSLQSPRRQQLVEQSGGESPL